MKRRFFCIFICTVLLILAGGFSGCKNNTAVIVLPGLPQTLDPQIESGKPGDWVFSFLYSRLLKSGENGEIFTDCAEQFFFSDDGRELTFILRPNLTWSNKTPLTSHDFAFALERVLSLETDSPYAVLFDAVEGAAAFRAKTGSLTGVSCPDDFTLKIKLTRSDEMILQCFAAPFMSPCNREFFNNTSGAYGITTSQTLANGRYTVISRSESAVRLKRKPQTKKSLPGELKFVKSSSYTSKELTSALSKKSAVMAQSESPLGVGSDIPGIEFGVKTFALAFCAPVPADAEPTSEPGAEESSPAIKPSFTRDIGFYRAMVWSACADMQKSNKITNIMPPGYTECYLDRSLPAQKPDYTRARADIAALLEKYKLKSIPKISFAVPDTPKARAVSDDLVEAWQANTGVFVSREYYDYNTLVSIYKSGRCDIALLAFDFFGTTPLAFYSSVAELLGEPDLSQAVALLNTADIHEFSTSAEQLIYSTERIYPVDYSPAYVYISDSRFYYSSAWGIAEMF